jgi:ATP-binding protein involved in chromosome partitioning
VAITRADVEQALDTIINPDTGKSFLAGKSVKEVKVDGDAVSVEIVLGYPARTVFDSVRQSIGDALRALPGVAKAEVKVESK